jgi:serine O-acetyltransferase
MLKTRRNKQFMNININNGFVKSVFSVIHHYDEKKYWNRRDYVIHRGGYKLLKYIYLMYIKRCDAFNNASMGTDLDHGAQFGSTPILPHGLNGIIISPDAKIGENCTIFHQVTIGNDYRDINNVPTIGDNVTIYPGAKIVGKLSIGNNVQIGANAVVTKDVPDNSLVVAEKCRIIEK